MVVHAPFRFVPIHRWVYFPEWGDLVTHDVPFKDGLSGEIEIEITAETPLLLGGPRRKPTKQQSGWVWPFETVDPATGERRYAIPGSALQGMVRSILEVAAFGRLGPFVDRRRFGFRDISNSATAIEHYRERMTSNAGGIVTQHTRAGWLIKGNGGAHRIIPCQFARMHVNELRNLKGGTNPDPTDVMGRRNDARQRYDWFLGALPKAGLDRVVHLEPPANHPHAGGGIRINYQRAFAATSPTRTAVNGTLVFTGKPQNGLGPGNKKYEFVFHAPDRPNAPARLAGALTVAPDVWEDFAYIHNHARLPGRRPNPNWEFWRPEYEVGQAVPVFYLTDHAGNVTTFGTAFMFKAALPLSTHDVLRNSSDEHLVESKSGDAKDQRLDLPSLIFGIATDAADNPGQAGLKRRAIFDPAIATLRPNNNDLHLLQRAILLEPKPSFYPSYVRQPGNQSTGVLDNPSKPFTLYASSPGSVQPERISPELSGVKVWPARNRVAAQGYPQHLANQAAIQSTLCALPAGTKFATILRLHNLRPMELGALLWALTFGEEAAWTHVGRRRLRHRLGMGKPYGFGEIGIRLKSVCLRDPGGAEQTPDVSGWIDQFSRAIDCAAATQGLNTTTNSRFQWAESVQVRTLLKASDPQEEQGQPFDYMDLNPQAGVNDFQAAKSEGRFLPRYAGGMEVQRSVIPSPAPAAASLPQVGTAGAGPVPGAGQANSARRRGAICYDETVEVLGEDGRRVHVRFASGDTEWVPREEVRFIS